VYWWCFGGGLSPTVIENARTQVGHEGRPYVVSGGIEVDDRPMRRRLLPGGWLLTDSGSCLKRPGGERLRRVSRSAGYAWKLFRAHARPVGDGLDGHATCGWVEIGCG